MVCYWQGPWLPNGDVYLHEESHRFKACVASLKVHVDEACKAHKDEPNAFQGVLNYIPILNNQVDIQQDVYELEDVLTCIRTLQDVVLSTKGDIEVQARAAQALTAILQEQKCRLSKRVRDEDGMLPAQEPGSAEVLRLRLDWKPWLDLMLELMDNPPPSVEGFALRKARQSSLQKLVASASRYFAPEAAFDIWHLLSPAIEGVAHDPITAYDALGWAVLFIPTYCISSFEPAAVNQLVGAWMECWGRMQNSTSWNGLWMSLLSRAAEHDYKGVIDWSPHLDVLFSHYIGAFDVPVGAATSMQATLRTDPMKAMMHHARSMGGVHTNGGAMIASLLRARAEDQRARECVKQTLERLRYLASLIDNYFHPSNTGKWCRELSAWTRSLVVTFMRLVGKQGATPPPWYAAIEPHTMTAFVACITPLASRGQFSKDESLSSACIYALSSFAYISPSAVLPLVVSRFRTAVESQTATHQLAATIVCLSGCIRPILLSGWGLDSAGESGEQLLAEALMALLPGIDANDEQKTMAVMQLYTTVLSSLPILAQAGDEKAAGKGAVCLPLYLEDWGEEVLGRLLALLGGLDSGLGHRADAAAGRGGSVSSHAAGGVGGGGTFLTMPGSFFPHLASLLFSRLPSDIGAALAKKTARFAASELLPGVEQAMGVLLHAAVEHHPEVTWTEGLSPLMQKILAELQPHIMQGHATPPSPSLEATLCYQMGLLRQGVFANTARVMLQRKQQLLDVVNAALAVSSWPIQNAGSALLGSICCVCVRYYTHVDLLDVPGQDGLRARMSLLGPRGIEQWVDKHATDCPVPKWSLPSPEALALVEHLIDSHLLSSLPRLLQLLNVAPASQGQQQQQAGAGSEGGHAQRMLLHGELVKMKGILVSVMSCLRDFDFLGHAKSTSPSVEFGPCISVLGNTGVTVGPVGTRERIAEALSAAAPAMLGLSDAECMGEFLLICGLVMSAGSLEHTGAVAMTLNARRLIQRVEQPPAANLLLLQRGGAAAEAAKGQPWRKQVPRWAAVAMLDQILATRAALSAFRSFATANMPELTSPASLPPSYRALAAMICKFATHSLSVARAEALPLVDAITKRFPHSIARTCLPHFLCALADVPPPVELAPNGAAAGNPQAEAFLLEQLSQAAIGGEGAAATQQGKGAGAQDEGSQVEKDGRVQGASAAMTTCSAFWRLVFRDPSAFACAVQALMASRTHTSMQAQGAISNLMIGFSSRFVKPATLAPGSPAFTKLAQQVLHLAHPETLRASWRYSLSANVLCLLLMPAPSAGNAAMPFARHALVLLADSNMLQLRQLATATLSVLLTRMVEFKEANPQLASEIKAWLQSPSGTCLAGHLAVDHTKLEASELNQDKREGLAAVQARLLNMTHDELILKVVAASMDSMQRWPEGGHAQLQPQAIRDGFFVVSHARLVSLLATIAPLETLHALKPALEQAAHNASNQQVVAYTSEKAVQAAAAEATAGLLAAGAPWMSEPAGGDGAHEHWLVQATALQLQTMSLEMSESWSLAIRFGVHGLISMVRPPATLTHLTHTPQVHPPPFTPNLPPNLAELALGTVLGLAQSMGPALVTGSVAASALGADGVLNSGPGQLKRLRTLHQCARELISLDIRDALRRGFPVAVQAFWAALLVELRASVHHDVFNLRQQLSKTLAMAISYLGGPSVGLTLTGGTSLVPAGGGLQAAQALAAAARAGQQSAAAASAAAAGSGLQAVQALRSDNGAAAAAKGNAGGTVGVEALQGAARALAADFLAALASATTVVRLLKFSGPKSGKSVSNGSSISDGVLVGKGDSSSLGGGSGEASNGGVSDAIMAISPPGSPEPTPGQGVSEAATAVAVCQVGLAAGVVSWGVLHGQLSSMRHVLLRSLPHLLRLQELAGPTTQNVAQEAAVALATLKYVPVGDGEGAALVTDALQGAATPASLPTVNAAAAATAAAAAAATATAASTAAATVAAHVGSQTEVEAAALAASQSAAAAAQAAALAGGELWSARAAALQFAQSFWFRSCFLLSRAAIKRLEDAVLSRLADAKPEVRVVAGATLSGMVRGMPEAEADSLRARLVADARTALKKVNGSSTAAAATGGAAVQTQQQLLLDKHGLVQGLKAFLLSSPYDCPAWMPSVLMTLVHFAASAAQEAPVRSAAAKALSEFKRTHEADSLQALKDMMDSDEWDCLQQVTSPASYFT